MIKKTCKLLLCIIIFATAPVYSQQLRKPDIWQIEEVNNGLITIINKASQEERTVSEVDTTVVQTTEKSYQDLNLGQFVRISGMQSDELLFRAFVVVLLPKTEFVGQRLNTGSGPRKVVFGEIVATDPLTIRSNENGETVVTLMPQTRFIEEIEVAISDALVGSQILLMNRKLVLLPDITNKKHSKRKNVLDRINDRNSFRRSRDHGMPIVPRMEPTNFDLKIVQQREQSIFGFKDPYILKPNIFSWYNDYGKTMNDLGGFWLEPSAIWSFHWNLIQKQNADGSYGAYSWDRYDRIVQNAQAQNLQITGKIHASLPQKNDEYTVKRTPTLPKDIRGYKTFVKAVVERYDGDGINDMPGLLYPVRNWKIEDEPIYPRFFDGNGKEYAKLLQHAYGAIKSADPNAVVICAMIYAVNGPLAERDPELFLSQFYDELSRLKGPNPYDIVDHHFITLDVNTPLKIRFNKFAKELSHIKETAVNSGFPIPVFQTLEMAIPFLDEKTQAQDLVKHHVFALSRGIKKILWSGIKAISESTGASTHRIKQDPFKQNAIIKGDGTKKLSYYSYKKMTSLLDGCDLNNITSLEVEDNNYIYRFSTRDGHIWVVWHEGEDNSEVKITLPMKIGQVQITEAIPQAENGGEIGPNDPKFNTSGSVDTSNTITLYATRTPLYIQALSH